MSKNKKIYESLVDIQDSLGKASLLPLKISLFWKQGVKQNSPCHIRLHEQIEPRGISRLGQTH